MAYGLFVPGSPRPIPSKANDVIRNLQRFIVFPALSLGLVGCASNRMALPGGYDIMEPIMEVKPPVQAVADIDDRVALYGDRTGNPGQDEFREMSLKSCLVRAVQCNRSLRRQTYAAQRAGLQLPVVRQDLYAPFVDADYTLIDADDFGAGEVRVTGRVAGFEIEPFVRFEYDEEADSGRGGSDVLSNYGVAVSRNLFRIRHEALRQHLPLTRANRDYHVAINDRMLELRQLHLRVVELFYDIQRLRKRISVRENRVKDAEEFLSDAFDQLAPRARRCLGRGHELVSFPGRSFRPAPPSRRSYREAGSNRLSPTARTNGQGNASRGRRARIARSMRAVAASSSIRKGLDFLRFFGPVWVRTKPGSNTVTSIPRGRSSMRRLSIRLVTPAFAAE